MTWAQAFVDMIYEVQQTLRPSAQLLSAIDMVSAIIGSEGRWQQEGAQRLFWG